jgi:acyl phosphate:glycerol-3-phosphate acyltransferase
MPPATLPWALVLLAYVLGATPTSFWVGKTVYGIDLRKVGSGNLGATNTFRALGWKAALPVMIVDVAKGWIPVALFPGWLAEGSSFGWVLAFAGAAIAGHVFSFWVGFRGGKGVATSAGAFLGLAPWAVLLAFGVWLGTVLLTRFVSLGSMLAAAALAISIFFTPHVGGGAVEWFSVALAAFVIWAHRANIGRLIRGEESRIGRGGRS